MTDTPWFKFYASDWLAGTRGLSPAETGAYVTLLAMIYENGGPIERDDRRLARLCNCAAGGFSKVIAALIEQRKIIEIDGRLTNERAEKEMGIRSDRSEKARDSAANRWRKHEGKTKQNQRAAHASAMQTQCDGNANQKPEVRKKKEDNPPPPDPTTARAQQEAVAGVSPDEFEAVLEAAGVDWRNDISGKWLASTPRWNVDRWRALGLTHAEVLIVAAESRPKNGPPGSLAYFDQAMQRAAGRKEADPLKPIAATKTADDPADKKRASWARMTAGFDTPNARRSA